MSLGKLKQTWKNSANSISQQKIWDNAADSYLGKPLPDFGSNIFLKTLLEKNAITPETTALDLGCGAGRYSLALAGKVKSVMGVDISPKMLGYACEQIRANGVTNASFQQLDWALADAGKLELYGAFDLVFAHKTPAISDFETLEKMNLCSRRHCFVVKPTRRKDEISELIFDELGIEKSNPDELISKIFEYLWKSGYYPELSYNTEHWSFDYTLGEAITNYLERTRLQRQLSHKETALVEEIVISRSTDGRVNQETDVSTVTIYWNKENRYDYD